MGFQYHFEPKAGWINDPNGLCWYNGQYHAFFQHNPYAPQWDQMHWGHAVSEDLVHWQQLDIALYPRERYENTGGCFSGSAIEKDGQLHLFYTSVSEQFSQTQSTAKSRDGLIFEKNPANPIIRESPYCVEGKNRNFRDPKVIFAFGRYYMVVGASSGNPNGQALLYTSEDLRDWRYVGAAYSTEEFGGTLECPDLFPLGDKWVLMFSAIKPTVASSVFVLGDFDGETFTAEKVCYSEVGVDFYAPQTLLAPDGRRIMIGWFYHWGKQLPEGASTAGALSIPRELTLQDGRLYNYPVAEARHLLTEACDFVKLEGTKLSVYGLDGQLLVSKELKGINGLETVESLEILFDEKAVEVFINKGQLSVSQWLI